MTFILGLGLQQGIFVWEKGVSSPNWNLDRKRGYISKRLCFVLLLYKLLLSCTWSTLNLFKVVSYGAEREGSKDFALMQSRMQLFAETGKNTLAPWALKFHEQEFYFQLNFRQR